VFRLRSRLVLLFFLIIHLLCLRLRFLLLRLLLLGLLLLVALGSHVLDSLFNEFELANNGGVDGLVVDCRVPTGDVGVLLAPLLLEEELESTREDASCEEIGKGDAVANEESVDEEVLLEHIYSLESFLASIVDVLLVVWVTASEGTEPRPDGREDLLIGKGHPSDYRCVILLGLAEKARLLILRGDYVVLASASSHRC
jgi:hypothetical protein